MRKKCNQMVNKTVLRLLTFLGIGSSSLLFMACYGPAPTGYQVIDDADSLVVMEGDSVAAVIDITDQTEADVAEQASTDEAEEAE